MKKLLALILLFSVLLISYSDVYSWTTHKQALVQDITKEEAISQLEDFVVTKGYSFDYINKKKGLFSIYVRSSG